MVIFYLGFLCLFLSSLKGRYLHALVLPNTTEVTSISAATLCSAYSDLDCPSAWTTTNDSFVITESNGNSTRKCSLEILSNQIKDLICSGDNPTSACNESVQKLMHRGPLPSCITGKTGGHVFPACPGNIPNSIPKEIRREIRKRFFSNRECLLLKESFIEKLLRDFGDLSKEFTEFHKEVERFSKSGNSAPKVFVKEWPAKEVNQSKCSDVRIIAIKTQSLLSKILCQTDMVSAKMYLMKQDLKILTEKVMVYNGLFDKLYKLHEIHPVYGVESLRCRLTIPFHEKIPRLILHLHRDKCDLNDQIGSPTHGESTSQLEILSKVEESTASILKTFEEIREDLTEVSHHLRHSSPRTVGNNADNNETLSIES